MLEERRRATGKIGGNLILSKISLQERPRCPPAPPPAQPPYSRERAPRARPPRSRTERRRGARGGRTRRRCCGRRTRNARYLPPLPTVAPTHVPTVHSSVDTSVAPRQDFAERQEAYERWEKVRLQLEELERCAPRGTPVLAGRAASLTPYQLGVPRPSPRTDRTRCVRAVSVLDSRAPSTCALRRDRRIRPLPLNPFNLVRDREEEALKEKGLKRAITGSINSRNFESNRTIKTTVRQSTNITTCRPSHTSSAPRRAAVPSDP
jgi:hypothetical protein